MYKPSINDSIHLKNARKHIVNFIADIIKNPKDFSNDLVVISPASMPTNINYTSTPSLLAPMNISMSFGFSQNASKPIESINPNYPDKNNTKLVAKINQTHITDPSSKFQMNNASSEESNSHIQDSVVNKTTADNDAKSSQDGINTNNSSDHQTTDAPKSISVHIQDLPVNKTIATDNDAKNSQDGINVFNSSDHQTNDTPKSISLHSQQNNSLIADGKNNTSNKENGPTVTNIGQTMMNSVPMLTKRFFTTNMGGEMGHSDSTLIVTTKSSGINDLTLPTNILKNNGGQNIGKY